LRTLKKDALCVASLIIILLVCGADLV
jgi:hypothetical protein